MSHVPQSAIRLLLALVVLFTLKQLTFAADRPFSITQDKTGVQIRVQKPSSLAEVVAEFCKVSNSKCEGVEYLASDLVSPVLITGSWSEVINSLMTGTGVNYLATQPGNGLPGQLILQRRSTVSNQVSPQPAVYNPQPVVHHGVSTLQPDVANEPVPAAATAFEPEVSQPVMGSGMSTQPAPAAVSLGTSPVAVANVAGTSTTDASAGSGSPFSMGRGQAIPAFNPGEGGSPFSYKGKPIPPTNPGQTVDTGPFPLRSSEQSGPPR